MIRPLFFAAVFFAVAVQSIAQRITVSGKVTDKDTHEPLPFASVWINGKPVGTITNLQGEFDFHLPAEYRNEMMVVSMLGYLSFEAPVWSLVDKLQTIQLEETTQVLNEVVVSDSLTSGDVLRIAISRIEQNFPMEPYLMDGFYRDTKKLGGTYISLLEAAIKVFDEDYKEPRNKFKLRERVALLEVRRSLGYSSKFTTYFDEDNLLEDLLLNNSVRYRQFPEEDIFFASLKREKNTYYNGHRVYVIVQNNGYKLKVYVDTENYSILHVEYEREQSEKWGKRRGLVGKFVNIRKTIDFKDYQGKMYLNYITVDSRINWYDNDTNELRFETELHQQLLINQIYPRTEQRIGTTEKMRNYGLQYQDLPYNKTFWEKYNVIKTTPLDRKIIGDLEKELPLEKQFEEGN
jgi:CarboxypepD_reg-like domain